MATSPAARADLLSPVLDEIRPGLGLLGFPAYVVDAQRRYRYLNAAYEAYFGRSAAEMLGRTVEEVFGPPPPDDRRAALNRALAGESLTFDREALHGPNQGRWIRLHYIPVRASGDVVAATVVLMDIQHLKDAQDAIAERERQLSLITDTIGFPVTYVDRDWETVHRRSVHGEARLRATNITGHCTRAATRAPRAVDPDSADSPG